MIQARSDYSNTYDRAYEFSVTTKIPQPKLTSWLVMSLPGTRKKPNSNEDAASMVTGTTGR